MPSVGFEKYMFIFPKLVKTIREKLKFSFILSMN